MTPGECRNQPGCQRPACACGRGCPEREPWPARDQPVEAAAAAWVARHAPLAAFGAVRRAFRAGAAWAAAQGVRDGTDA